MIRRSSIIFLEFLAGLVAGGIVLLIAGAWWLWSGPVALTFLTPYVEEALSPSDNTIAVEIEETVLDWAGWDRAPDIRASNVRVLDFERRIIAELPKVKLGLSLQALLRGKFAPTYLQIDRPSLSVVRGAQGGFAVGLAMETDKGQGGVSHENVVLEGLIAELLLEPDLSRPLGYLKRVGVVDADLLVDDQMLRKIWHAPRANIDLVRNVNGISASADVDLELGGERSKLTGIATYATESRFIDATVNFVDIDPAPILKSMSQAPAQRIADMGLRFNGSLGFRILADGAVRSVRFDLNSGMGRILGDVAVGSDGYGVSVELDGENLQWSVLSTAFPEISDFARVDFLINGKLSIQGATDGSVESIIFDVAGGDGTIDLPQIYPEALPIRATKLRGQVTDNLRQIRIENAELTLEKGRVISRATATKVGGDWSVRVDGGVFEFVGSLLPRYWPPALAVDARNWVLGHIRKGQVDEASISLVARFPDGEAARANIESLNGVIRVKEAEIDYFAPLPVVEGVRADMTFTDKRFDIVVSEGQIRDLQLDEGSVVITGLDGADQDISIDLVLRGAVQTAVSVLDSEPLRFISGLGFDAKTLSGETAARLVFDFPITKSLRIENVAVAAAATLRDVQLQEGPLGLSLDKGDLSLQLTGLGMTVSGEAEINDVPLKINWQENFSGTEKFVRRFTVNGSVGAEARRKLQLPEVPILTGDLSGEIAYTAFSDGRSEIVSQIDLSSAALDIPQLRWRKPSGIPGSLYAFIIAPPEGPPIVEDLRLEAADMRLGARIEPTADLSGVRLVELRKLVFGNNDIQGRVRVLENGSLDFEMTGDRFDIEPFLSSNDEVDAIAGESGRPLRIQASIKEVLLGEGRGLKDVNAVLNRDGESWRQVGVDAGIDGGIRLAVKFVPKGDGATLLISTGDAGLALEAANWSSRLKGGRLLITGAQPAPGDAITGEFNLKEFKVTEAPALARVLQVLSLTGIFSALNQEGLDFVTLEGDFRYYGGALEIKNARAFGSTLGITAKGAVYISDETADLSGTVVPAYTINSALGYIPVVGKFLTGGENEGIFAANYAVKGRLENPRVSVNPLSALAPGFLRNLIGTNVKPLTGEDAVSPSQ